MLVPFLLLLLIIAIFNFPTALLLSAIFVSLRGIGEMVYWIHQQFGDRKYRPNGFGFKNLDSNAIYILYQLIALLMATAGVWGVVVLTR